MRPAGNHDIIVIGGSAGALEPLRRIVAALPADLPAAVFVVLHLGEISHLPGLLDRAGPLSAAAAAAGEAVVPGRVYVAVPDLHLLLHDGHVLLRRGPRENLSRPAIDPLFRSAAASFGGRVVGVVLSGSLNDGTTAIRRCGGLSVVQDPASAAHPSMPQSALERLAPDHCVPHTEIGALLARLAGTPAEESPEVPQDIRLEAAIAAQELSGMPLEERLGELSPLTCPDCGGTLWEIADPAVTRYRCHLGHAFTGDVALEAQSAQYERLLETLMRASRERAELARRLAREQGGCDGGWADRLEKRAAGYDEDAELARRLLSRLNDAAPQWDSSHGTIHGGQSEPTPQAGGTATGAG